MRFSGTQSSDEDRQGQLVAREHPGSIAFDLPQVIRLSIRMARGGRSLMEFTGRKSLLDGGGRKPPEMVAEVLNLDIFRD